MKRIGFALCLIASLALDALPAWCQEAKGITSYQEVVELLADGTAKVAVNVALAGWEADKIELPLNFAKAEKLAATAKTRKVTAAAGKTGDVRVIKLQFDGKPAPDETVQIAFTAKDFFDWAKAGTPRGIYGFAYTFTNATATNIGGYKLKVLLPTGYAMSGVTSSTPRATGEEVEPPYDFATEGQRLVVNLRSKSVASGRTAAIAFGFANDDRKALAVILLGIVIAGLALYLKRNVLTDPNFVKETVV